MCGNNDTTFIRRLPLLAAQSNFVPQTKPKVYAIENFTFPALHIAAFLTVLMTYFGVNFLLGGMHSYVG